MRKHAWLLVGALAAVGACDSEGSTEPPPGLEGTWEATRIEFVRVANTSQRVDVVPLGGSLTLTLSVGGSFTVVYAPPDEAPLSMAGNWVASRDELTLNYTSGLTGTHQFDMTLNGNTLTLNGAHTSFEFQDGGANEEALLNLVLARQ